MKVKEIRTAVITMTYDEYSEVKNALALLSVFTTLCEDVLGTNISLDDAYDFIDDDTVVQITKENKDE